MNEDEKKLFKDEVENFLGKDWLESNGLNPIQIAWKRKDHFAKTEILILGKCLNVLKYQHYDWLNNNLSSIKTGDYNNAHGTIFEVLLAGYQKIIEQEKNIFKVNPAKLNQQGYDISLNFEDGFRDYISIKWLGSSYHNELFHGKMKKVELELKQYITKYPYNFNIIIALTRYPRNEQEWSRIGGKTKKYLTQYLPMEDFIRMS